VNFTCYHTIRIFTLILCLVCLTKFSFAEVIPHCLGSNLNEKDIAYADTVRHFGVLLDKTNNLPIGAVVQSDFEWRDTTAFNQNHINQEKLKSRSSLWRYISIINDTDTIYNWVFQVHQVGLYEIYTKKNDSISYVGIVREHTNYDDRLYRSAWNVYPFKLASGDSVEVYVKCRVNKYLNLDMSTKTLHRKKMELLQSNSSLKSKFQFAFIMLGFFLSLFILSQFAIHRDKAYVYYGIYLLMGSLYFLHRYEADFECSIFFAGCLKHYSKFEPFLTYGLLLSYTLFGREFGDFKGESKIQVDKYVKRLMYWTLFALAIHVLMIALSYDEYLNPTNRLIKVGLLVFILPVCLVFYRNRTRLTYIFLIGTSILLIGLVMAFTNRFIIESFTRFSDMKYDSYATMRVLSLLDFFFFLLALAYKARLVQEDKNRAELQVLQEQFKVLKTQLNPHFIFNCLNSIKGLIKKNKNIIAEEYLESFANLTRNILSYSEKQDITLDKELEIATHYLKMEALRFNHSFKYHINTDKDIDLEDVYMPPLILQPYLENAIKHGLRPQTGEKILRIDIYRKEENIICAIEDTGIGRAKALEKKQKSGIKTLSFGMKINQNTIEQYNKIKEKEAVKLNIIDKTNTNGEAIGTRVEIVLIGQ